MRRLFIAINLPEDIKRKIGEAIEKIKNNPQLPEDIRWTPPDNWHLTLVFLGYQPQEIIPAITEAIKQTVKNYSDILKNIRIVFDEIILAPPNKTPRMIWLAGAKETSEILGRLKNDLENNLIKNGVGFKKESRKYNCHLTLARFPLISGTSDVFNIRCPKIENLSFTIQSLDLMESHLKRTGAEYEILARVDFK